ncbi:hypothetical protein JX266_003324 [Neoarthrinium moseri]|nr:hypothetical protein JX266_003324 [Neoarthrinium moseri]
MAKHPGGDVGRRLLPVIIDEVARDDPHKAWASLPIDDYDLSQGFEDITYAAFANGINKLAHFIVKAFGTSDNFETIVYLGIPDLRYYMLLYAVCKTGHKVLFNSHLNTLDLHLSLIDQAKCHAMLLARGVYAEDITNSRPMPKAEIPELDDLLDPSDPVAPFPYTKSFAEAQHDPFVICQTSGATGDPRPVTFTHASMACMDSQTELQDVDGRPHWTWKCDVGTRYLMMASPFHPIAVVLAMTVSAFGGGVLIPGFRHRSVDNINEVCGIIKGSGATTGFMPYFLADVIARLPDAEQYIKQFDSMTYGNGSVSDYAGEVWSKHSRLQCVWGASELLSPPFLEGDPEDYAYVFFDTKNGGVEFRERDLEYYDDDGSRLPLYELVMVFNPTSQRFAGYWAGRGITSAPTKPPYPEYATAEVWTPHPDPKKSKYAWRFISRIPDLESRNNEFGFGLEKALGYHEKVQNAIVLTRYNAQPIALIELSKGVDRASAATLWAEAIAPENEGVPEHARVPESHVIFVPFGNFIRGSEGHFLRRQTERKYANEIDYVYGKARKTSVIGGKPRYESIIETTEVVRTVEQENTDRHFPVRDQKV